MTYKTAYSTLHLLPSYTLITWFCSLRSAKISATIHHFHQCNTQTESSQQPAI